MENKELLKTYIEALETQNDLLKAKEDISADDKLDNKVLDDVKEMSDEDKDKKEMDEDPKKETEAMDDEDKKEEDEEPTQMERLVKVITAISEKVNLIEARYKEENEDDKKEELEDEKTEGIDENKGVNATDDNGLKTTTPPNKDINPTEPEAGAKQTTGATEDNITKNEGVDEEDPKKDTSKEAAEDEDKKESDDGDEDDKKEGVDDEDKKEMDDEKSEAADDEESSEKEPQAPVVEGINKLQIKSSFKENVALKSAMSKMKLFKR